jgi:hypothetical protein
MKIMKAVDLPSPKPASAPGQARGAEPRPKVTIRERARRADIRKALTILKQAGKGNPPVPGDER